MIYDKCASMNSNGDVVIFFYNDHAHNLKEVGKIKICFFCSVNALMSLFLGVPYYWIELHDAP